MSGILKVLFIGNSHTYFNDMPKIFKEKADKAGYISAVTMMAMDDNVCLINITQS